MLADVGGYHMLGFSVAAFLVQQCMPHGAAGFLELHGYVYVVILTHSITAA